MRALAAFLLLAAPAQAAPTPGLADGDRGWRFATCQMEGVCQGSGEDACIAMPLPGRTYLWRDADGITIGTSASAATTIDAFDRREDGDALASTTEGSASFIVIGPGDEGPGWLRFALFRITGGSVDARYFRMTCETADQAPPDVEDAEPPTAVPEGLVPAAPQDGGTSEGEP